LLHATIMHRPKRNTTPSAVPNKEVIKNTHLGSAITKTRDGHKITRKYKASFVSPHKLQNVNSFTAHYILLCGSRKRLFHYDLAFDVRTVNSQKHESLTLQLGI